MESVEDYYQLADQLFREMRASRTFGISEKAFKIFQNQRKKHLASFLHEGIEQKRNELDNTESPVEETLFFYPLVGVINKIAYEVVQSNQS
jgi:hypothetical protein